MNYKNIVKRDTLFIEYLESTIKEYKEYYQYTIDAFESYKEQNLNYLNEIESKILLREIKALEYVLEEFYQITDKINKD